MNRIALATISISLLSGCATGSKDTILPQTGPTMKVEYALPGETEGRE